MRIYDVILKKKNKKILTQEEIGFFIDGIMDGSIKEHETSALLMAIAINGMNSEEIFNLTIAMRDSGSIINLKGINGITVDKHSTGGVSDSTTLVIAPIVACLGVKMPKMSGRSLGFTGGTADKVEVFTGYNVNLSQRDFISVVNNVGASIITQTKNLAPADKILYSIRNLTGSVESIPLIASSIMSKKLASNADVIVLDVKYGDGAFMKTLSRATQLARTMVDIGKRAGKKIQAVITNMEEPLGSGIGGNLEVKNAINVLKGKNNNLAKVSKTLAQRMLLLSGAYDAKTAKKAVNDVITSGSALIKLQEMIRAHGGDDQIITRWELMKKPKVIRVVKAKKTGFINKIKTAELGYIVKELGGGRASKHARINHSVGIKLFIKLNSKVKKGDKIAEIHASSASASLLAEKRVQQAFVIKGQKANKGRLIEAIIR
jgi:pyrimidine-nucleoside phosphorylase